MQASSFPIDEDTCAYYAPIWGGEGVLEIENVPRRTFAYGEPTK